MSNPNPNEEELIVGKDGITYKATTLLRKRKITDEQRDKRAKMRLEALKDKKERMKNPDLKNKVKRLEKFIMEYRANQKNFVDQKKRALNPISDEINGKVVMALRLRNNKNLTDRQKILLKTLKLKKNHEVSFIQVSPKTEMALKVCEPFITFGFPNRSTVKRIIQKRAFCKVANDYIPLNSNALVEEHLGHLGLICIDDLVTILTRGGKQFNDVLSFLGAFKLNKPTGGYGVKEKPFRDGGAWGNRGEAINDLVVGMI